VRGQGVKTIINFFNGYNRLAPIALLQKLTRIIAKNSVKNALHLEIILFCRNMCNNSILISDKNITKFVLRFNCIFEHFRREILCKSTCRK
jgi:hypothetical protein